MRARDRRRTGRCSRLERCRVITEKRADGRVSTEATIKIVHRRRARRARPAEGNGPINALDTALRAAIEPSVHPQLREIELVNFKVRILDEDKGTGAVTRVLLDSSDGEETWGVDGGRRERDRGVLGRAGRLA